MEMEHLSESLESEGGSLRRPPALGERGLENVGITDLRDRAKILTAIWETWLGARRFLRWPGSSMPGHAGELARFLVEANGNCGRLTDTVRRASEQLAADPRRDVLSVADGLVKSALALDGLIGCVQDLGEQVEALRKALQKVDEDQKRAPTRVPSLEEYFYQTDRFLKNITMGFFWTGIVFLFLKFRN